ncbi:Abhydrolase domain-containing protein mpaH [Hypsizygus marmoreus]|uniref:Abhydrolase domain-containing protein mpaH n=1 Tax=Hypsizygus marmoreus TaxID=39966 RepID=A0A369K451_HYPMA|nr:Abhydrolase domain-containing protein mpaH [Hypsizygus marmoreus]
MIITMSSESYVFDPRPNYPLVVTAKRYWKQSSPYLDDPEALTLIFAHGTGFHKEQWEPTMDELNILLEGNHGAFKVREMWSIDAPNHGDAAVLNEKALKWGYEPVFGWEEYGRTLHAFLTGFGTGVDVDFSKRRLVGIGHSMGASCLILSLGYSPTIKFESLILCELMSMAQRYTGKPSSMLVNGAVNRRDIWPTREDAYKLLKSRPAWKAWDDRVLRIFVNEGMRPLPTVDYPDKTDGVTLKCSRIQETACYRDPLGPSRPYIMLKHVAKRLPVHMIYGAIDDYIPREVKEDVVKNAAGGEENLASLSRVENAGHLVIQMNPTGLAQRIHEALFLTFGSRKLQARL